MHPMCKSLRYFLCLLLLFVSILTHASNELHRQAIVKYLANIHAQQQYELEIHNGIESMLEKMPLLKSQQKSILKSVRCTLPWHTMRSLLISSIIQNYSAEDLKLAIGSSPSLNTNDEKLVNQLVDMTNDTIKRTVDFNIKTAIRSINKQYYEHTNKAAYD